MKKISRVLAVIALLAITFTSKAQTANEVLSTDIPITWFGFDFSHAKGIMLGTTPYEMKNNFIPAINQLFLQEPQKFDINKGFNKSKVTPDFSSVNKVNANINIDNFEVTTKEQVTPLTEVEIADMVKQYSISDKQGVGLVFIVESLDKVSVEATLHLTFFSMPDGKIILTEKVYGKPGGFGIRNYWANTLFSILKGNTVKTLKAKYSK